MNADASVYELAGYIQSTLKPKIEIVAPPWDMQEQIVRAKCPQVDEDLLGQVLTELKDWAGKGLRDSTRDMLALALYVQKLRDCGTVAPLELALSQVLEKGGE